MGWGTWGQLAPVSARPCGCTTALLFPAFFSYGPGGADTLLVWDTKFLVSLCFSFSEYLLCNFKLSANSFASERLHVKIWKEVIYSEDRNHSSFLDRESLFLDSWATLKVQNVKECIPLDFLCYYFLKMGLDIKLVSQSRNGRPPGDAWLAR